MPIDTKYNGYDDNIKKVTKVRDFKAGQDQIKSKGETYLPKLSGQKDQEYKHYKLRGYVIPAVSPTQAAITGAIMRKPPVAEVTSGFDVTDVDGNGQSIENFTSFLFDELQEAGAVGCLVEFDDRTKRNTIKTYIKESIINIYSTFVVLAQTYQEQAENDKYMIETKTEYLELTFDENGNYIQNVWREQAGSGKGWSIFDTFTPTNRGEPLKEIPFVMCGELMNDPILLDLANVNLDQYLLSTDQRWGLHWTALPTLNVFGELTDEEGNKKQLTVGAGSSNQLDDTDARIELLEFTGAGIGALKQAIEEDIHTMASIGAKMLTSEQGGVKAAETARIEASSETATLSNMANTVEECVTQLLVIIAEWQNAAGEQKFTVNRDFIDSKLDAPTLLAYLKTYLSGGMSKHTFLSLLEKGDLLPKGITADDEAERIETTGVDFSDEVDV